MHINLKSSHSCEANFVWRLQFANLMLTSFLHRSGTSIPVNTKARNNLERFKCNSCKLSHWDFMLTSWCFTKHEDTLHVLAGIKFQEAWLCAVYFLLCFKVQAQYTFVDVPIHFVVEQGQTLWAILRRPSKLVRNLVDQTFQWYATLPPFLKCVLQIVPSHVVSPCHSP